MERLAKTAIDPLVEHRQNYGFRRIKLTLQKKTLKNGTKGIQEHSRADFFTFSLVTIGQIKIKIKIGRSGFTEKLFKRHLL